MQYSDDRHHLRIDIDVQACDIPDDERARMQTLLAPLGAAVQDFPASELGIKVIYHPRSQLYHVEFELRLPGQTLFTGEEDSYLDTAYQRGLRKLLRKVEAYKEHPDRRAVEVAGQRTALDRDVVAPEDPADGPLADAVRTGDYRTFRTALAGYEEWLRKRVGRWVQRDPEAEARVGRGLSIGDLVEEVYLNAFERFPERPTAIRLSEWLDRLIDPSLKALLRHPDEERENASMARTVREGSLG
jgi:ribosome-associated translation inhibitor RaiA